MSKSHYVHCPFCEGLMEIDGETGDVLKKWPAGEKLPEGADKMSAALKKLDDAKKKRVGLFDKKKEEMEEQKRKLEEAFRKEVEKAKKEGVSENPIRPFDLD